MPKSTGSVSLSEISIASIFVESILYGLFISLFISSTSILLKRIRRTDRHSTINKRLLLVSTLMLVLSTIHVGVDLRRVIDAFITHNHSEGGADKYLNQVNSVTYLVKSVAYALLTFVGDGFILYRLYLVWNGDKRVVYPILLCFIASLGVGAGTLQSVGRASPSAPIFIKDLQKWIASFFSLTLFTNFSSTLLIAIRIWWARHQNKRLHVEGRSLNRAAIIIVESGAIYSIGLAFLLGLYLSGNYAQYIALDAVTQLIGITFSLVIVRVALGISSDAITTTSQGSRSHPSFPPRDVGSNRGRDTPTDGMLYSLKPLNVEVTTETNVHTDSQV